MRVAIVAIFLIGTLIAVSSVLAQGQATAPTSNESSTPITNAIPTGTLAATPPFGISTPEATSTPKSTPTPATPEPATPVPTVEQVTTPDPTPVPTVEPTSEPTPEPEPEPATSGPHLDPGWAAAIQTLDGGTVGRIISDSLNLRSTPTLDGAVVGTAYHGHPITIYGEVVGDSVDGINVWYQVGPDAYITAAYVEPFIPEAPVASYAGNWVDINLSNHYAIAYSGDTPVHAAIFIAGKAGFETPVGEWTIFRRVENETMDGTTIGIPKDDPEYYYLENVGYTQYFTPGADALHENYWSSPAAYGANASHGCINLQGQDAIWFWNFLTEGSPVSVHY